MDEGKSAIKYEREFLENYFRAQAKKKLEKLDDKIRNYKSRDKLVVYQRERRSILAELESDLKELCSMVGEGETETTERREVSGDFKHGELTIPHDIWNKLFSHQQEGVLWMLNLFNKKQGGILADEMGLGKTLQAIALIYILYFNSMLKEVVIVCPATVVSYWISELREHAPEISVSEVKDKRKQLVTVTSYESFKKIANKQLDLLILDEGHKIKNKDAQITQAVKAVLSRSRFILTGTPIQNNLAELWSLMDFVSPGLLGSYVIFQSEFEENIKNRTNSETSYKYSIMLRTVIEPHILRRLKGTIAKYLPEKTDQVIFVNLTAQQESLYLRELKSKRIERIMKSKEAFLSAIDILRKVCNHPLLLFKHISNEDTEYDIVESSCKIIVLLDLLNRWRISNNKVLLFTQTVQMQKILERVLKRQSFSFITMSGITPLSARKSLVKRFSEDDGIFVFLLTTRVGGLGLNLTAASKIVLYDPDWNPSTDNQAKERVHRYGQKTNVEIYRFICKNTVEERVYQKQIYKNCLSKKILKNPRIQFRGEDIIDLFEYKRQIKDDIEMLTYEDEHTEPSMLQEVREEDRASFELMREMNGKKLLSGEELIEYIERREMSLL